MSYVTNEGTEAKEANGGNFFVRTVKDTDSTTTKWKDAQAVLMGEQSNIPGLMVTDDTNRNLLAVWSSGAANPAGSLVSQKLKVVVT